MDASNSQAASETEMFFDMHTEFINAEEVDLVEIADTAAVAVEYGSDNEEEIDGEHIDAIEISGEVQDYNDSDIIDSDAESIEDKKPIMGFLMPKKNLVEANAENDDDDEDEAVSVKRKVGRPRLVQSTQKKKVIKPKATLGMGRGRKKLEEEPASIMCELCGNIYSKRSMLNMHMRRHLSNKPFECEYVFVFHF